MESKMNSKQFVKQLGQDNDALFTASEMQVEAFFKGIDAKGKPGKKPPKKIDLIEHFTGRMVNERMNMVQISEKIANLPADADPKEARLLSKQAMDEAKHFEMVKDVIEHIQGSPVNVGEAIAKEKAKPTAKGADLLDKYDAQNNPIALALYQFIAEGRAEVVWNKMAEVIDDDYIASRYAKIARDEGFHSKIGRNQLEKLCEKPFTQACVMIMAKQFRKDLFEISCMNTTALPEAKKLVEDAYA